ncbi:MAG: arylsulfatase [Fuerstiella sp.]|nr:arylsulfatase [Fuerstiella sp.]MCP4856804.1 arylsulfatase [Fuerstiella sp.]
MKHPILCLTAAVCSISSATRVTCAVESTTAERDRPNIVYIMADDLGYGDLGCYGQSKIQTPNIDRLATNGMKFTDFYAGSTVCAPSRCVLMTGLHTGHCFIRGNGKDNLRPEDVTVAEVLKQADYATGQVGKWGLGHEGSTGVPTKQGFDFFFGYLDQHHAHLYYPTFLIRNERRVTLKNVVPDEGEWGQGIASRKVDYSPALMMDETLGFIDDHKAENFFLYLSYTLPHANNEAMRKTGDGTAVPDHGRYRNRDWTKQNKGQAAMIGYLDQMVGQVMKRLADHNLTDNTIVFFTSDNGPHSEGGNDVAFFDANGPVTGIKRTMYDGGIRVPMIVQWPGHVKAGSTTNLVAGGVDFLATAADIARVDVKTATDGISFLPTLLGKNDEQVEHEYLYWEFYEQGSKQALRAGPWKAVRRPIGGPIEVYHVAGDIGEENDLAPKRPDLVARFTRIFDEAHTPADRWQIRGNPITRTRARAEGR